MIRNKRDASGQLVARAAPRAVDVEFRAEQNRCIFEAIRDHIDTNIKRRERLVQASREVTVAAKNLIFELHRVGIEVLYMRRERARDCDETEASQSRLFGTRRAEGNDPQARLAGVDMRLTQIANLILSRIAPELDEDKAAAAVFHRAYSPGLQEFVEALSMRYFLETGALISLDQVQRFFDECAKRTSENECAATELCVLRADEKRAAFTLNPADYLLGLGDLGGELMRVAVTAVSRGDEDTPRDILKFLRELQTHMETFAQPFSVPTASFGPNEYGGKVAELQRSVHKVERVCYALSMRKSEVSVLYDADSSAAVEHLQRVIEGELRTASVISHEDA